jgi:hypothetical protein
MYRQSLAQSMLMITGPALALVLSNSVQAQETPEKTDESVQSDVVAPSETAEPEEGDRNWVDNSHGYVTDRANALTRWVDDFFGDQEADQDMAESRLRVRFIEDWDQTQDNRFRVRVSGKVNLPKASRRLDLVFQGDDPDSAISGRDDPDQGQIGLQYQVTKDVDEPHGRFDLTLGLNSSGPRPGVRYRYDGLLNEDAAIRFTQRVQYEFDDGAFATTRLNIDHRLSDSTLIRSATRLLIGEETDGLEWSTTLGHAARWSTLLGRERASFIYAGLSGRTDPYVYEDNYFVGARYRMQAYRDYLFFEVEPSYNWRVNEPFLDRRGAWKVELRLELLLDNNLRRDERAAKR